MNQGPLTLLPCMLLPELIPLFAGKSQPFRSLCSHALLILGLFGMGELTGQVSGQNASTFHLFLHTKRFLSLYKFNSLVFQKKNPGSKVFFLISLACVNLLKHFVLQNITFSYCLSTYLLKFWNILYILHMQSYLSSIFKLFTHKIILRPE